jgi:hypothetical protein
MKTTPVRKLTSGFAALLLGMTLATPNAHAADNIIRSFQTTRTMSMGGVKITTGLYDENFLGNPARAAANSKWKLQILDLYAEANGTSLSTIGDMFGGGGNDVLSKLSSTSGSSNHIRVGMTLLGVHIPGEKMSYSFGLNLSTQADVVLDNFYRVDPQTIADLGPTLLVTRKFLENKLVVGVGARFQYRVSSKSGFTFVDIIKGKSLSPAQSGGEGGLIDFDLGATYQLPWKPLEFDMEAGLAFNNLLGGTYDKLDLDLVDNELDPATGKPRVATPANRTMGLGVSFRKPELWKFTDFVLAVEASDIGNNKDGSFFRWLHIGAEAQWKLLKIRAGSNQGYWAVGLGLDLKVLQLDAGTWGEEMSLNTGGLQNRVLGFRLGLNI